MNLLREVVDRLRQEGIRHALIGAAAMAVHGVSRSTVDVDLLTVDPRSLEAELWAPVAGDGVTLRILKGDFDDPLAGSVRLSAPGERMVDVVVGRHGWQAEIVEHAEPVTIGGLELPVVGPAGLVLLDTGEATARGHEMAKPVDFNQPASVVLSLANTDQQMEKAEPGGRRRPQAVPGLRFPLSTDLLD